MEIEEDRQAEPIAAEWGVDVDLLEETDWVVETIDGNDGEIYGYIVRFDDGTAPEVLAQLGVTPGQFSRQLSVNAFDEPEPEPDDFEFVEPLERLNDGRRSYYINDERFTPSQFRRLSRKRKVEAMVQWFHENYEDPAVRTPYESAEGGYQWIWGGPYDAREQIGDEFSDIADEDIVEAASAEVTSDGLFDWAPKVRREDYEQDDEPDDGIYSIDEPLPDTLNSFEDEDVGNPFPELPPGQPHLTNEDGSILTDEGGRILIGDIPVSERETSATAQGDALRREMLSRLDRLEAALQTYEENLPPRNHNHPPELVEPDPISPREWRVVVEATVEIRAEAQQPLPDPVKLEAHASTLRTVAGSIFAWLGRKADTAVDSAIKWAVPVVGAAWMLAGPDVVYANLMAVAESIATWAQHLLAG
ncbi:hypothetical protein [Mesorhizobium cantuariense]|uniref:Uncharacterized protein n=1 Tax=Mesorhizobium cantuariense TaxID=1300275 RepID=A0ABV7MLB7_9HYPH